MIHTIQVLKSRMNTKKTITIKMVFLLLIFID